MKLKGISPIEQHAEKGLLALVVLAGLGALVMQFLPGGNLVKVGNERVPPGQAFTPVAREAQTLLSRIDSQEPRFPEAPKFTLADRMTFASPAPAGPAVAMGVPPRIGTGTISTVLASGLYAAPAVPAPTAPVVTTYSATLHPAEKLRTPDLATILPARQPFDLSAVSLEFSFDGASLRAALERDPDDAGPMEPIPLSWWRDSGSGGDQVLILAVEVERELVRDAEGRSAPAGSKPELIGPMPGRFSALGAWTESVRSVGDVPSALDAVRFRASEIERPAFYATIAGPEWRAPSVVLAEGDPLEKQRQVRQLREQFNRRQAQLPALEERLQRAGQPDTRREERRTEAPSPGRGRPGAGGGGGSPPPAPTRTEPSAGDPRQIQRAIDTIRRDLDSIAQKLIALGETVEGYESGAQAAGADEFREPTPLLDNSDVRLWAHDLRPQPGATYRYRARVVINNPLFDRNLQESQKALGASSMIRGPWSEWSAPVTTDPRQVVFVVSAEERSAISPRPRATAEVYEFYYGYYRKASVGLEPGDVVLGSARLPELRAADMAKLQEALTSGPGAAAPTARSPETPRTPETPRGPRAPMAPTQPAPGGRSPAVPASPEGGQMWPEWMSVELPRTLDFEVDVQLLDVLSVNTEGRQRTQVVMRRADGTLATRLPDLERANPLLRRLEASEKAGQTQGREPTRTETPTVIPTRPDATPQTPRPGRSGGGGGG